jgi:hypothetical protein
MKLSLRRHQRETVEVCREILEGKPIREIILSVTAGGGKSFVPVVIADHVEFRPKAQGREEQPSAPPDDRDISF